MKSGRYDKGIHQPLPATTRRSRRSILRLLRSAMSVQKQCPFHTVSVGSILQNDTKSRSRPDKRRLCKINMERGQEICHVIEVVSNVGWFDMLESPSLMPDSDSDQAADSLYMGSALELKQIGEEHSLVLITFGRLLCSLSRIAIQCDHHRATTTVFRLAGWLLVNNPYCRTSLADMTKEVIRLDDISAADWRDPWLVLIKIRCALYVYAFDQTKGGMCRSTKILKEPTNNITSKISWLHD